MDDYIQLTPGMYQLNLKVSWKNRPNERFRRELFSLEVCDKDGIIIEAARHLWLINEETHKYASLFSCNFGYNIKLCFLLYASVGVDFEIAPLRAFLNVAI